MIWEPTPGWIERTNVMRFMRRLGFEDREAFLRFSRERLEEFWDAMVRETRVAWSHPYERVLDESRGPEWARWFIGGRLNIVANCLDRHPPDRLACIWEGEDGATRAIAFGELRRDVNRLANRLRALGLVKGDRVAMLMPMTPEVLTILYACLKLGLIVTPIFAGFGPAAIATRLEDSGARVVFTAEHLTRRGQRLPLREKITTPVEHVLVCNQDLLRGQSEQCETLDLDSEDPALLLYTSGTTGKPKGVVHTHAGALAQITKEIWLAFDHQDADRFFWLSDIGWMMGPWSILGNHHFGGAIFMYDGAPDFPAPDRLWQMIERHGITTLGISPTAIRMLMRNSRPERFGLDSLRLLGSTGEPWDDKSWMWYFERVGGRRCPVINISGGTEIVGCFLFPLPIQPLEPCTVGGPAPGIATEVFDENGRPVRGRKGYLVCTRPAPSMTRGLWGDPQRYIAGYWSRWPGIWFHGDWASVSEDGLWYLHGRADESMNVAGRKVGPAEIEDALIRHPAVAEAAVIGVPDELKGEAIVGFVVARPGAAVEPNELRGHVAALLGPAFRPKAIHTVPELPKTQSGKIVRRLIRRRYLGEEPDDLSTVQNPAALTAFGRPFPKSEQP